ncbi:MAG: tRNA pseudouridine(38-40) synthase TruA [Elstera sp.]
MPRYRFTLEYDGTPYSGWQRQRSGVPSVQAAVEQALLACTQEVVTVHTCGRTDAGVHARGQVAHVTLAKEWSPYRLMQAVNFHLKPQPVAILDARAVADDWHARFSCIGRWYLYRILCRTAPPALERNRVWSVAYTLDAEAMQEGARRLIGLHDFTSFRASLCQADSPIRTLDRLEVSRVGEEIHIIAAARSFLHHQVRNMVGTLALVGQKKWTADDVTAALEAKDRSAAGPTAPAEGLYFMGAVYPETE